MNEKKVIDFYLLCNKLKSIIRTGWKDWHVSCERLESVAEHVYGTQMLAISMKYQFDYDIDIEKVIMMLAIHELGETLIGDLTLFDISSEEKKIREHNAVHQILDEYFDNTFIEDIFLEFDEKETKEALFAYQCDKLEADIQAKIYDSKGYVDINNQENTKEMKDEKVQQYLKETNSWSKMWIKFGQDRYPYDEHFTKISNYLLNNDVNNQYIIDYCSDKRSLSREY